MKKIKISLVTILLILVSTNLFADVVIGTSNNQDQAIPIEPYFEYTYSQSIYLASEINATGTITGLQWYWNGIDSGSVSDSVTIYMANTTKSSFTSYNDWEPSTSLTLVFSGEVSYPPGPGWVTITFTTPFAYNGTSNLLVAVEEDKPGYDLDDDDFLSSPVSTVRSITFYDDIINPSHVSPPFADDLLSYIPNVVLQGLTQSCPTPTFPNVFDISTSTADIAWTGNSSTYLLEYGPSGFNPGSGIMVNTSTDTAYLTGLSIASDYDYYLRAVCGLDSSSWTGPFHFTTPCNTFGAPYIDSVESHLATTASNISNCWSSNPSNTGSAYRWDVTNTGTTPNWGTGATVAHSGTNFFYTASDWGSVGSHAELYAPNIDLGPVAANTLSFWYHMHGLNMGNLYIEINNGSGWAAIDSIKGQQQSVQSDPWLQKLITLTDTGVVTFRFRAIRGSNFNTDICLDDIEIFSVGGCNTLPAHTTLSSDSLACISSALILSLDTNIGINNSGIQYQWQSSSDGINYVDISGANGASYSTFQNTATYYQCIISCSISGDSTTSTALFVPQDSVVNCYCTSGASSTTYEDIGQFTIGAFANPSTPPTPQTNNTTSTNTYTDFTGLGAIPIYSQITLPISIYQIVQSSAQYDCYAKVYVDMDQNGIFDPLSEVIFQGSLNINNNYHLTGTTSIPATALTGITMMRVVLDETTNAIAVQPCGSYDWGETEDYLINISTIAPCTSLTPTIALASDSTVCENHPFTLSLDTTFVAQGISYQWQVSTTGPSSGFTNITNGTSSIQSTTQSTASWYRCIITCNSGPISDTSSVVAVGIKSFIDCYCPSGALYFDDDDIGQVIIGTTANPAIQPTPQTGNSTAINTYTDYKNLPPIQLSYGMPTAIAVYQINQYSSQYDCWASAFIDYNQDGVLDTATERIFSSVSDANNSFSPFGSFIVPSTALSGVTLLRVILKEYGSHASTIPCEMYDYGETEDYLVNIGTCTFSGVSLGADTTLCSSNSLTLDAGSGYASYLWSNGDTTQTTTITNAGTYYVGVTNNAGCIGGDSIVVTVTPGPNLDLGSDTVICPGDTVLLDAGVADDYLWSTSETTSTINIYTAGAYTVLVTDNMGCTATDTISITVTAALSASNIAPTQITDFSYSFTSNASNATDYQWYFGDGNTASGPTVSHTYDSSMTVDIILVISNDCETDTLFLNNYRIGYPESINNPSKDIFKLYPNPTSGHVTLELKELGQIDDILLINPLGQTVPIQYSIRDLRTFDITIPEISPGHYMIRIWIEGNNYNQNLIIR